MAVLKEPEELEKDPEEGGDEDEPEATPEPQEVPQDPNEPIEVVTADAQKQARKERRAQRQSEFRQAQEERDRLRRENDDLRARQTYHQPPPQYQQPQPQVHPAAQRLAQLDQMEKQLHDHYRARASQQGYDPNGPEQAEFERKAREINVARMGVVAQAQQPQFNEAEVIRKAQLQMYLNEHADISQDPAKMQWAYARWQQYRAEVKEDTKEMSDAVFEEARRRFGMKTRNGSSQAADPATRQRLSGVPSRGSGASSGTPGAIQMSADDKKMARIAFGDRKDAKGNQWSEAQVYQHWANTVGKKRQEQSKGG